LCDFFKRATGLSRQKLGHRIGTRYFAKFTRNMKLAVLIAHITQRLSSQPAQNLLHFFSRTSTGIGYWARGLQMHTLRMKQPEE
jgi:hypothetical protein